MALPFIAPQDWNPIGIEDLEPNAWKALRHARSTCVVAGPGAGKTEFLAQKVTYLLQTGRCPPPFHILAISFKKDASENLAERVRKRCPPEQARRFVSMTFDSFTKGLTDRFYQAIPEAWRPTRTYEVIFPKPREVRDFLTQVQTDAPSVNWQREIAECTSANFEPKVVGGSRLVSPRSKPKNGREYAVGCWWEVNWGHQPQSRLTFTMINRLAELLLRENKQLLRALRLTYPFVFLDEFQDTTYAQYDFLLTAFYGSDATLTAVGDDKQRIMVWAGARADAFTRFATDFDATRIQLLFNYRSSPELVRIQHVVACAIEEGTVASQSRVMSTLDGEAVQICTFADEVAEANLIARAIRSSMQKRNLGPRDYALLVRQKAEQFEAQLQPAFAQNGLMIRNEAKAIGKTTLQDLLSEELTRIALSIVRFCVNTRAPEAWQASCEALALIRGVDPDDAAGLQQVDKDLSSFRRELRAALRGAPSARCAERVIRQVFELLDLQALAQAVMQYSVGDHLAIVEEATILHFVDCAKRTRDWADALDMFEGIGQIPLMTVHKSKGLEYDTVIFVGLDDDAWWSHSPRNPEGQSTFFVALSRAKQRAIFTYCRSREREKVADLYELLRAAGVQERHF